MDESYINRVFPDHLPIWWVSNPRTVINKFNMLYDDTTSRIYPSTRKDKKYMLLHLPTRRFIHFGSMLYQDHTKHQNDDRRLKYLHRATKIKGNWKEDKYSPNNLAINLLW